MTWLCRSIKVNYLVNESITQASNFGVPITWTPGIPTAPFVDSLRSWSKNTPPLIATATLGLCRQFSTTFHWIDPVTGTPPTVTYQKEKKLSLLFSDENYNPVAFDIPGPVNDVIVDATTDQVDQEHPLIVAFVNAVKANCVSIYGKKIPYFIRAKIIRTKSTVNKFL